MREEHFRRQTNTASVRFNLIKLALNLPLAVNNLQLYARHEALPLIFINPQTHVGLQHSKTNHAEVVSWTQGSHDEAKRLSPSN